MKKLNVIIFSLLSSLSASGNLENIKKDYASDGELYGQFLDLGNSVCLDNVLYSQGFYKKITITFLKNILKH
ncbi:hypothetical protein C3007_09305 [Avibacterium gallinarum]|uniref:hypothetical protein n=1 Tax=Avibacterium gallinarum TaxID=755 RepID=UPI000CDE3A50|nr:hypothetical protein [Avibacterium gallinarum]POY43585.1 hypothetical protein C3007_09305 [Avibacterium gallinarum]